MMKILENKDNILYIGEIEKESLPQEAIVVLKEIYFSGKMINPSSKSVIVLPKHKVFEVEVELNIELEIKNDVIFFPRLNGIIQQHLVLTVDWIEEKINGKIKGKFLIYTSCDKKYIDFVLKSDNSRVIADGKIIICEYK